MFTQEEEQSEHQTAATSLTLQSLIDARHDVHHHHSTASSTGTRFPGQRAAQRRGQGLEFIDLRQYNPGDDVRHIDWNVTARSNEPYTRLFREEREQITTVIVDIRPLMFTGSDCLRSVYAGQLAARTLWQACEQGDRCAALVISANGLTSSKPGAGKAGVLRALELITRDFAATNDYIHTGNKSVDQPPLLSDTLAFTHQNRRASGRYILFSGMDTEDDSQWAELLPVTAMSAQLKAVLILDRLEQEILPAGHYRYQSHRGTAVTNIGSNNTDAYATHLQKNLTARTRPLTDNGISHLTLSTIIPPAEFPVRLQQEGWL